MTARSPISACCRSPKCERLLAETNDFKFNVGLVIIDFLIRQGYLTPDDPRLQRPGDGRFAEALR